MPRLGYFCGSFCEAGGNLTGLDEPCKLSGGWSLAVRQKLRFQRLQDVGCSRAEGSDVEGPSCFTDRVDLDFEAVLRQGVYDSFGPFNEADAREELIDIWHFVVQASLELNLTPDDIVSEYKKKNEIKRNRQKNGY